MLVMVMVAPGTTDWLWSVIVPVMLPRLVWAKTENALKSAIATRRFIVFSLQLLKLVDLARY